MNHIVLVVSTMRFSLFSSQEMVQEMSCSFVFFPSGIRPEHLNRVKINDRMVSP